MEVEYRGAPAADQNDLHAMCAKVTEMALADPFFLSYKNSTIGLAAVLHAARLLGGREPHASSSSCKAFLKVLQKSKIMLPTTCTKKHQQNPTTASTNTLADEKEKHDKKNQICGYELEVVYTRLEQLLCS
jgi:Cyclin, C-terminal domain